MSDLEFHPLSNIVPMVEGRKFAKLVDDIRQRGLIEPIIIYEDKILDGRTRYRACAEAGVKPRFHTYTGNDPFGEVISLNLKRRHLDESQRAMVAAKLATLGKGRPEKIRQLTDLTQQQAADLLNVSDRSIQRAVIVRDCGCEPLVKAVEQGDIISINAAAMVAKLAASIRDSVIAKLDAGMKAAEAIRQAKREAIPAQVAALPDGIYRVLYVDPPWKYNDSKQGGRWHTTSAIDHYADQTLDKLKQVDVQSIAADNSVLFCWVPFPLIEDALELIKVWGFKYKTAFIWDKGAGFFGNYHNVEAEQLLVCTRGSCMPEVDKKEHQIQRFPKTKHSKKPEEFRALIDRIYPPHPPKIDRVELFRRGGVPENWRTWGAEAESEAAA